MLITLLY